MPTTNTWNHFMETEDQKWVVFDGNQIPKTDVILEFLSAKMQDSENLGSVGYEKYKGKRMSPIRNRRYFENVGFG